MNISGAKNAYFIFDDFIVRTGHQVVKQVKVQAVPSVYNSDVFSFRIFMNRGLNYEKYFLIHKAAKAEVNPKKLNRPYVQILLLIFQRSSPFFYP